MVENKLCLEIGHDWRATTASNFRVCGRANCHAVQLYKHGRWIAVPQRSTGKQRILSPVEPERAGFSSGNTLFE